MSSISHSKRNLPPPPAIVGTTSSNYSDDEDASYSDSPPLRPAVPHLEDIESEDEDSDQDSDLRRPAGDDPDQTSDEEEEDDDDDDEEGSLPPRDPPHAPEPPSHSRSTHPKVAAVEEDLYSLSPEDSASHPSGPTSRHSHSHVAAPSSHTSSSHHSRRGFEAPQAPSAYQRSIPDRTRPRRQTSYSHRGVEPEYDDPPRRKPPGPDQIYESRRRNSEAVAGIPEYSYDGHPHYAGGRRSRHRAEYMGPDSDGHHYYPSSSHPAQPHHASVVQYQPPDPFVYYSNGNVTSPFQPGAVNPQPGYFPGYPPQHGAAGALVHHSAYPYYPPYIPQNHIPASPPATEKPSEPSASQKAMEEKLKDLKDALAKQQEYMVKQEEDRKKKEEEREKAIQAAAAAAKAKADQEEEAKKIAQELAKAAESAKAQAEKKAEEAAKKASEEHEKVLKEAKEALEKALAAEKKAKEEAAKLKPPPDAGKQIAFKDAVGRKFNFPWALCKTWKGMEDLIRQAFANIEGLDEQVQAGRYDLIGPDGEIILPKIWESTVSAGWAITMHMWQEPEPEPAPHPMMMPPGYPAAPPGKDKGKGKADKKKGGKEKPRPVSMVDMTGPPPPPGMMPAMMMGEAMTAGVEVIPDKKSKPKRRTSSSVPPGLAWFAGGGGRGRKGK